MPKYQTSRAKDLELRLWLDVQDSEKVVSRNHANDWINNQYKRVARA